MSKKMLVVTNRRLEDPNANNETMFGEAPHVEGPGEVRLAWAEKVGGNWSLSLIDEQVGSDMPPSRSAFGEFRTQLAENDQNCVFYIHGYNKTFEESIKQGWAIQDEYGPGVVTFSWAANPGGWTPSEYPKARAIARASSPALDNTLEKLGRYMAEDGDVDCQTSVNLLVHSLGNYLFQTFVEKPLYTGETRIFDNLILQQADVDTEGHEHWVNKLRYARRVYITVNERDKVLDVSDVVNPDRLGNTSSGFVAERARYIDFTEAAKIGKAHQLWGKVSKKNPIVRKFFQQALNGEVAETITGIRFNPSKNAFEVS